MSGFQSVPDHADLTTQFTGWGITESDGTADASNGRRAAELDIARIA